MKLLTRALSLAAFSALAFGLTLPQARAQSDSQILVLDPGGHTSIVRQTVFTPSGKELISIGEDKVVRVWDTKTGKQIGAIHGQIGEGVHDKLYAAALSRDGKTLAVAGTTYEGELSEDASRNRVYIRLYHLDDLRSQPMRVSMTLLPTDKSIKTHADSILTLAFSPTDNHLLASGGLDRAVCVWNIQTGKPLWDIDAISNDDYHRGPITGLAWSADGKRVASSSFDKTVHVWDVQKAKVVKSLDCGQPVTSVAWSADGKTLAAGMTSDSGASEIRLFNAADFRGQKSWKQPQGVSSLAFSPDGRTLVSGEAGVGPSFPVHLWSLPEGSPAGTWTQNDANVTSIAFSGDGSLVASAGGRGNDIYLRHWPDTSSSLHLAGIGGTASDVSWSEDGGAGGKPPLYRLKWSTGGSSTAHVFDFTRAMLVNPPAATVWQPAAVKTAAGKTLSLSEDKLSVTISGGGNTISFPPKPDEKDLNGQNDFVLAYSFLPNGNVVVGSRYTLALYQASDGSLIQKFVGHSGPINSVSVSPDGKYLASASSDQTVAVWPLPRRASSTPASPLVRLFAEGDGNSDEFIAWNPDFGYYACSPKGQQLIGWQANNGEDQMADYAPASSFFSRNRAEVISRLLDKGNAVDAIIAAGASQEAVVQTAPLITIASLDGSTTGQEKARVRVTVTPRKNNPLTRVDVSVNDHLRVQTTFTDDGSGSFHKDGDSWVADLPVKLKAGAKNEISAVAVGADKNESVKALTQITSLLPAQTGLPALNLLAIGISEYDRFVDLTYPDADARELAQVFQAQQGKAFSKVDVTVLTNEKATRANILAALKSLADKGESQGDNDYTIVFVAGHGGDLDATHYYLIPSDADTSSADKVQKTAVAFTDLDQTLETMPGNVLLLMDACHAGGKGGSDNAGYASVMNLLQNRIIQGESPIISFLSCKANETSKESPAWQHGAFTRALLDGLRGAADSNHDGTVDVDELQGYVRRHVEDMVAGQAKTDGGQTPQVLGLETTHAASLPLAHIGATASAPQKSIRQALK